MILWVKIILLRILMTPLLLLIIWIPPFFICGCWFLYYESIKWDLEYANLNNTTRRRTRNK